MINYWKSSKISSHKSLLFRNYEIKYNNRVDSKARLFSAHWFTEMIFCSVVSAVTYPSMVVIYPKV